MTGEDKHIDKLFRDGLSGLREKPPAYSWSRLDQSLDNKRNRRKKMYYWLAAATVLILMAFGAGYFYASYLRQPVEFAKEEIIQDPVPDVLPDNTPETPSILTDQPESDALAGHEAIKEEKAPVASSDSEETNTQQIAFSEQDTHKNTGVADVTEKSATDKFHSDDMTISTLAFLDAKEIRMADQSSGIDPETSEKPVYHYYGNVGHYPEDYELKTPPAINKWSVGAQFAPTYSYREISANYGDNVSATQQAVDGLNDVEEGLLSYAGGVDVGYNFSGKWSLQSGVYFSRIGQVNSDALQFKQGKNELVLYAINTSTGNINVSFDRVPENIKKIETPKDSIDMGGISNVKIIQNFDLFEIPFLIRYKFLNRKFSMNFSGGLSPAYLIGNDTYLESEEGKYDIGDAGNLNSMIVNTSLGLGFEYLVTKKLSLNFEPTFKYSLNPINNSSSINYHPYYFSWFTGIRLKIN